MTELFSTPWLARLIQRALADRWCVKFGCTTCAASVYRAALVQEAAKHAGLKIPPSRYNRDGLAESPILLHLKKPLLVPCLQALCNGLCELDRLNLTDTYDSEQALRIALADSYYAGARLGINVADLLQGTWAGQKLAAMQQHTIAVRQQQRLHDDLCKKRHIQKIRQRAEAHRKRLDARNSRNANRAKFIAEFDAKRAVDRLKSLLDPAMPFPIDAIPEDLIPIDLETVKLLNKDERAALLTLIDRRRKAPWSRLRRALLQLK